MKFYFCKNCKKIIISDSACSCCGSLMEEIKANTKDATLEKHMPVVEKDNDSYIVKVGEVLHPMEKEHYITFICLYLEDGYMIKYLRPGMNPTCTFKTKSTPKAVYEYCNLHGLWKKDI